MIPRPVKIIIDNEDIPIVGNMKTNGVTPIRNVYTRPMHPFQYLFRIFMRMALLICAMPQQSPSRTRGFYPPAILITTILIDYCFVV